MRFLRLIALTGLTGMLCARAERSERNFWPIRVEQLAPSGAGGRRVEAWQGGGPLFFRTTLDDGGSAGGFRPFYVWRKNSAGLTTETDFLYPLLTHRESETDRRWSLFSLVNLYGTKVAAVPGERHFEIWPFYFSRETGDPATSYHAVFPLHGTLLDRFGYDRISWTLFPLYGRFERAGIVKTAVPWPFVRIIEGDGNRGFALWPLFGWQAKAGVYRDQFYLWPLIYRNTSELKAPVPTVKLGVLPFYTSERRAGARSETFLWPFFGYTHRTTPDRYDETRWLWPFLVQGRGDVRRVNRWGPLYTHSNIKGDDKRWVLWPLWRQEKWAETGLAQTKTQLLYFFYWSLEQRSAARPALPPARKTHVWPFFSYWNNGAGRRQLQVLSPFEVFFQYNDPVRLAYTPLAALYRYDQRTPDDVRSSFLWGAITWRRSPGHREFHLGPLLRLSSAPDRRRITLAGGLIGLRRGPDTRSWRWFLFDFSRKMDKTTLTAASP